MKVECGKTPWLKGTMTGRIHGWQDQKLHCTVSVKQPPLCASCPSQLLSGLANALQFCLVLCYRKHCPTLFPFHSWSWGCTHLCPKAFHNSANIKWETTLCLKAFCKSQPHFTLTPCLNHTLNTRQEAIMCEYTQHLRPSFYYDHHVTGSQYSNVQISKYR